LRPVRTPLVVQLDLRTDLWSHSGANREQANPS
jgi:hypothetical protein